MRHHEVRANVVHRHADPLAEGISLELAAALGSGIMK